MVLSAFLDETVKPKNLCVARHPSLSWLGWAPLMDAVCYECSWCCVRSGGPCLRMCQGSKCTHVHAQAHHMPVYMCASTPLMHIAALCSHTHMHAHTCPHACAYMCMQPYTCMYTHPHACVYVCKHPTHSHSCFLQPHTHACTHVHMPVHMCTSTHPHTLT